MYGPVNHDISRFFVAGINYKKSDASIRGQFAVNAGTYALILAEAETQGVQELFILSTCNRTEIYGIAADPSRLIDLLCKHTAGSKPLFSSLAYTRGGIDAVNHLFQVSAGLDSQILGDYEIVGQIKQAVRVAREHGRIGAFTERLFNCVLQSSKTIKNQTALSGGTVSVSFSAVQYIRSNVRNLAEKKILLAGIGKIGRNTCRNLVDYLPTKNITLVNRTDEKAGLLAAELGLRHARYENFRDEIRDADIVLVATNAPEPVITAADVEGSGTKLLIDLSIPYNVDAQTKNQPGLTLVNVDELSRLKDSTLHKRQAEVPKALAIIEAHVADFLEWHEMRKHVPVLRAVKNKLQEIHGSAHFFNMTPCTGPANADHRERIQKVINGMALKMRGRNQRGCHYIEAINEFIAHGAN